MPQPLQMAEGERDGTVSEYDANGTLLAKGVYQQGKRKEQ